MDKDLYQSQIGNETVRQLNQGLFQIQTELDNLKTQIQADKQNKMYERNYSNCDCDERPKRKAYDKYSVKEDNILNELADQIVFLSNEVRDLKIHNSSEVTDVITAVNKEIENCFVDVTKTVKSFDEMLADVKKSIVEKVESEFSEIVSKEFSGEDGRLNKLVENVALGVEQKIELKFTDMFLELNRVTDAIKAQSDNHERFEKIAETIATGVEEKLEIKFSEMFMELNRLTESAKSQNESAQKKIDLDENQNGDNFNKQIVDRLDILTLRMDTFEKLLGRNTESLIAERQGTFIVDNQPLVERFDKLAEIVVNNIPEKETAKDNIELDGNTIEFAEIKLKINTLTEMLKARKEVDLRPLFVILNELDDKLADVKYGVNETMSKISTVKVDEAGNIKNEKTQNILSEIPRLVKESVASCLINVDDQEDKVAFEKLMNQINMVYANDEQKYAELIKQISEIKAELSIQDTTSQSEVSNFKQSEMEETLSSLRGELTTLSKFILEAEDDKTVESTDAEIPNAIQDASSELDGLTKEIFNDKRED